MAYDPSKDEILDSKRVDVSEGRWLEVVLARYDGGEPKIGINRCSTAKDGSKKYWNLGRMRIEAAGEVAEAIQELRAEFPSAAGRTGTGS